MLTKDKEIGRIRAEKNEVLKSKNEIQNSLQAQTTKFSEQARKNESQQK